MIFTVPEMNVKFDFMSGTVRICLTLFFFWSSTNRGHTGCLNMLVLGYLQNMEVELHPDQIFHPHPCALKPCQNWLCVCASTVLDVQDEILGSQRAYCSDSRVCGPPRGIWYRLLLSYKIKKLWWCFQFSHIYFFKMNFGVSFKWKIIYIF